MKDRKFISWEEAVQWLKQQPDQNEFIQACFYDDPLQESVERYYQSTEWREVQNLLSSARRGKALDIGAGRGISTYALAKDGWSVTALEPDPSEVVGSGAIKKLVQTGLDITVVEEYAETLPFADNSYDLVYGRAVLHHAKNLKKFCQEAARVLKSGGIFLATREHVISEKNDLRKFLDSHPLHSMYGGENAYLLSEYKDAMTGAGLNIKKIFYSYDSNINLFPATKKEIRGQIAKKTKCNLPQWLIDRIAIPILSKYDNTPGRLFSFLGTKS